MGIFKSLFLVMLVAGLISSVFAATPLELDLDERINTQLLPSSQYYIDLEEALDFDSVKEVDPNSWRSFDREQFKFGFISAPLWVRTTLNTKGSRERDISLKLHHSLDKLSLSIGTEYEHTQILTFGLGTKPIDLDAYNDAYTATEIQPNAVTVRLSPNKTYHLYLKANGANPIVADFRAMDNETTISEAQVRNSWFYAYLLLALFITIYSAGLYFLSREIAYLYHVGYMLSAMLYLLTDTSHISAWFGLYNLETIQTVTLLSLTSGLLSMKLFFRSMYSSFYKYSPTVKTIYNLLIYASLLISLLVFITSYELAVKLFCIHVAVVILMATYLLFVSPIKNILKGFFTDYRLIILRVTLLIFSPLASIHLITRTGFIEVNWFTDFVLFLGVFIEIFLISGMMLINLRRSKKAFQYKELINTFSELPNNIALEKQFTSSTCTTQQTLVQIWVSGFDGLQTTLGTEVFRAFLVSFGVQAKQAFKDKPFLARTHVATETSHPLFHSDLNTFVLLCRTLNEKDEQEIIETFKTVINASIDPYHEHFDFKVSVGAHKFNNGDSGFESAIQKSNLALTDGIKNHLSFNYYTEQIGFKEARRNRLINDFQQSLRNGEFFLLWQPQYDAHNKVISGVELLARWDHEEYGLVSPDEFIPLLEQSHRIRDLTRWVINKVFEELPTLHASAGKVEASINLSTRDLSNNDLIQLLEKKLKYHKDLVPYITLEITESMMIDDYQVVMSHVSRLQELGFKISIDDFGSGYASFSYLQEFPANELKIDRCYTERFEEPRTSAILESVIELAKCLNISIVVEGIESTQQIEQFTRLGVDKLQGWALGKPMSLDDLIIKTS